MLRLGNFLFRHRNYVFPIIYLLAIVPGPPIFKDDRVALVLGVAVALAGQILRALTIGLADIKRGGRDGKVAADTLQTDGVFNHSRNPLYLGNILILLGVAVALNALWFLLFGWTAFLLGYHAIIRAEETFLRGGFGEAYLDYCRRTPRLWVQWRGLLATLGSMDFNWSRLMVKEYGTVFAWTSGLWFGLVVKQHLHAQTSFTWRPADTIMAALLGVLLVLYAVARYLKKFRLLRV